ncbi:MAG: PilT/PilU family type 4a pilus ATPase [Candidatus Omnitrophota bacterium]|nr:MAG: PilT/PilU family type 4a pilus ATPase [Candidatus Omnitrophota bacterium]
MNFKEILEIMINRNISDIFLRANSHLKGRINAQIEKVSDNVLDVKALERIVKEITDEKNRQVLEAKKSCEFTIWHGDHWRFRVGIFYQRNTPSMVIRKIDLRLPSFDKLNLPSQVLRKFCRERRGLILVTGVTGSGKSTSIASMMEYINVNMGRHILTIEEPIEFVFGDKKCMVNQRQIGLDVANYTDALRQFAVHSPDVIYISNIRDQETCYAALTAAETGVLVFSTLHTVNASSTVERIVNFFPPHQHHFILDQLSTLLKGVLSLRLIPRADRLGLIPAYEVLTLSPSISRLLRENKILEIPKYISSGDVYGMRSFHQCLVDLVEKKTITAETALEYADKREELEMELRNKGLI